MKYQYQKSRFNSTLVQLKAYCTAFLRQKEKVSILP